MKLKKLILEHFHELSKSQKKVAIYVMDHPQEVAMSSAQELGSKIGVSETTVIRFCYSLSFSGYAELQKTTRNQLYSKESSLSMYRQSKEAFEEKSDFFERVMEQDRQAILETMEQIKREDYEMAVKRLTEAETIYVIGLWSSYAAANWFTFTLGLVKGNTHLIRCEAEDVVQRISEMNDKSVVVAISFHRYLRETIQIAKLSKKRQAYVIGITDSMLAPIHLFSDILFPIYSPSKTTMDATPALFSFMNSLVAGVTVNEKADFEKRQEFFKEIESDSFFVEGADVE